jgi:hypothetical protein
MAPPGVGVITTKSEGLIMRYATNFFKCSVDSHLKQRYESESLLTRLYK